MTVPDDAIEAVALEIAAVAGGYAYSGEYLDEARRALEAAMPAIREALAQEIEASEDVLPRCQREAARIVRGGTP